jgi:hypothetical protein
MDNTNMVTGGSANKINKILLFIFGAVVVVTLALVSVYLYDQYGLAGNKKVGAGQATPIPGAVSQNDAELISKTVPTAYETALAPANVGKPYKAEIQASVNNLNVQIFGRLGSELPAGLLLTACKTEYNSSAVPGLAAKNSLVRCTVEGTPSKSGNYTVRIYLAVEGGPSESFKDIPLVVNP